jgi:hypothetical protein
MANTKGKGICSSCGIACDGSKDRKTKLCKDCYLNTVRVHPESFCKICSKPAADRRSSVCGDCYNNRVLYKDTGLFDPKSADYIQVRRRLREGAELKSKLKTKYNTSVEHWEEMLREQNDCCAICGIHKDKLKKRLNIDHDHNCCPGEGSCGKCIRGLLCSVCNSAIGLLKDSEEIVETALNYLKNNRKAVVK